MDRNFRILKSRSDNKVKFSKNNFTSLAYQTAGWLNYEEEYLRQRLENAKKEGWTRVKVCRLSGVRDNYKINKIFKAKVGSQNHADDARRLQVCREVLGDGKDTIDSIS